MGCLKYENGCKGGTDVHRMNETVRVRGPVIKANIGIDPLIEDKTEDMFMAYL